ncbi:predicted protein [Naegleria gruberi]|uniref:Predicted protein n=1 Tax=Naegleria gruberi TaxID=5762 RepID=D2V778_NAEGR|nr:uncharacterized protein NAEGRDRAFT_47220 [Naegleria gruberi]EFC47209.1 predicted protein [Naegleria gruberi]|eukprot:XP_002679953.1 predicted protein [Naegleria gruberi strain NEG-M]
MIILPSGYTPTLRQSHSNQNVENNSSSYLNNLQNMINEACYSDVVGSYLKTELVDAYMQKNPFPNNQSIMEEGVTRLGYLLKYSNDNVKRNKNLVSSALNDEYQNEVFEFSHESLRCDKSFIIENVIGKCHVILPYLCDELKRDKELILKIIERNCRDLYYAPDELKSDRDIIAMAGRTNLMVAYENGSKEIQQDREFWKDLMSSKCCSFVFGIPFPLNNDLEMMNIAVERNSFFAISSTSNELRNDRELILKAVKLDGWALKWASVELQDDFEIVLEAVKCTGLAFEYASEKLRNNEIITMEAVKTYPNALYHTPTLYDNWQIVMTAVKVNGWALKWASDKLQGDFEIALEAVKSNGEALQFASKELRSNKMIVMEAVKQNEFSIRFASEELQNDSEVVAASRKYRISKM